MFDWEGEFHGGAPIFKRVKLFLRFTFGTEVVQRPNYVILNSLLHINMKPENIDTIQVLMLDPPTTNFTIVDWPFRFLKLNLFII